MDHLLLIHGALGSKEQFKQLEKKLFNDFIIHAFNLTAHGGNEIPENTLSIELFANDILSYMQQ